MPDVFLRSEKARRAVVGEAKTGRDLETRHSRAQLLAYLMFLRDYSNGLLVVSVPWPSVIQARSLLAHIQRSNGLSVPTLVLDYK